MSIDTLNAYLTRGFIGLALLATTFCAAEEETQTQPERISVGTRALSQSEWVKIQQDRTDQIEKVRKGEISVDDEQVKLALEQESSEDSATQKDFVTYYTTHQGAFHFPIAVTLLGENVELEDGSIWVVNPNDRYNTLNWMTGDVIIITPNHALFSSYMYCLVNLNTGAVVRVNLALGPIYNGIFTHWIIAIDYFHRQICLEDGSVWSISWFDDSIMNKWLVNDTIIIGINDGLLSSFNPNMLINVNVNNNVVGNCIN